MVPENDDFLVMQQLKAGKESAFHTLFKKYFSVLTLYAYKILKDEDAARDVVQSVFTKVYEQRDTLEIRVSIKSFLYQSVRNRSLNELKSIQIKNATTTIFMPTPPSWAMMGILLWKKLNWRLRLFRLLAGCRVNAGRFLR